MTLPEKEPCLTPVLSSSWLLFQAKWVFRGLLLKLKTCCLMLRVNTPLSWAPTTHTGKPSPWGTDSPLCPLSQEGLRTGNSYTETNTGLSHTFPRITLPSWWGLEHTAAGGCWGPASAGSRGTLRMNGVGERERPDYGCAAESGSALLVLQETRVFSAYFFVYEGLIHYLLALGPIDILRPRWMQSCFP